ncbi:MAG: hypothetical protein JW994_05350 [Candidatus Omnitrophica bacterium]|nr:hypothetical protein [Candidatus Omnitrophota bacterium]
MEHMKTKAIENVERKMDGIDSGSLRYRILQSVKDFKTSWIGLGQALYSVWKDKLYKEWGYGQFDVYTSKEIGIRKQTAMKLLRSYYFLEKEEPEYIKNDPSTPAETAKLPSYETIDALRLARKRKEIDSSDYARIKDNVLKSGKDARDVRAALTQLIKEREELEPNEARAKRRIAVIKRMIGVLKSLREEARVAKILPAGIINDTEKLIGKLESEL